MNASKKMENRKQDHIDLALQSRTDKPDSAFYYEPLLGKHPGEGERIPIPFGSKVMLAPIWISSMTGGTEEAKHINRNLAMACAEFGLGMGLGSCRPLLHSRERFDDFNLRPILGPDRPFYANLGLAQIDELIQKKEISRINDLLGQLDADGLIVHINPLQEWLQPEGDRYERPALLILEDLLRFAEFPVIVKEVGQGMGPESLKILLQMPLAAIEFAAFGGTNFSKLEWLRAEDSKQAHQYPFIRVGHTAEEMLGYISKILQYENLQLRTHRLIISGGIRDFLHGFACIQQSPLPAVYGQASAFLSHAREGYDKLQTFVQAQITGLQMAGQFLHLKNQDPASGFKSECL